MNTNSFSNSYKEAGVDVTAGYKAVELAVKAANGEAVSDVDTGAQWYDSAASAASAVCLSLT